jgi:uncharacterized damage-inducible protein DinB
MTQPSLSYPIGSFVRPEKIRKSDIKTWIKDIENLPKQLKKAVDGLNDAQLDTPYRDGGWTVRQVIHHIADSHLNAYIRTKWTLTEDHPTIKAYDEKAWAEQEDGKTAPIALSMTLIVALHKRWVASLKSLQPADFERGFYHPENKIDIQLKNLMALYSWHGRHHTAHITSLRERMGW